MVGSRSSLEQRGCMSVGGTRGFAGERRLGGSWMDRVVTGGTWLEEKIGASGWRASSVWTCLADTKRRVVWVDQLVEGKTPVRLCS